MYLLRYNWSRQKLGYIKLNNEREKVVPWCYALERNEEQIRDEPKNTYFEEKAK